MEDNFREFENLKSYTRKGLMPMWMKIFCWIFMIAGVISIAGAGLSLLGKPISLAIFGLDAAVNYPYQLVLVVSVYVINGIAAFYLWTERDRAILISQLSAYWGILMCVVSTAIAMGNGSFTVRLEIIAVIIFLRRINKMEYNWDNIQY